VCAVEHLDLQFDSSPTLPDPSIERFASLSEGTVIPRTHNSAKQLAAGQRLCERPTELPCSSRVSHPSEWTASVDPARKGSAEHLSALVTAAVSTAFLSLASRHRDTMFTADLYEDEDIAVSSFGLDTADDVSDAHVFALLADAEAAILSATALSEDAVAAEAAGVLEMLPSRADLEAVKECVSLGVDGAYPVELIVGGSADSAAAHWMLRNHDQLRQFRSVSDATPYRVTLASTDVDPSPEEANRILATQTPEEITEVMAAVDADIRLWADAHGDDLTAWDATAREWASSSHIVSVVHRLRWLRSVLGGMLLMRRAVEMLPCTGERPVGMSVEKPVELQAPVLQAAMVAWGLANTWIKTVGSTLTSATRRVESSADAAALGRSQVRSTSTVSRLVEGPAGSVDEAILGSMLAANQPRYTPPETLSNVVERAIAQADSLRVVCCVRTIATADDGARALALLGRLAGGLRLKPSLGERERSAVVAACQNAVDFIASQSSSFCHAVPGTVCLEPLLDMTDVLRGGGKTEFDCIVRSRLLLLLLPPFRGDKVLGVKTAREIVEEGFVARGVGMETLRLSLPASVVTMASQRILPLIRLMCMSNERYHRALTGQVAEWAAVHGEAWNVDGTPPSEYEAAASSGKKKSTSAESRAERNLPLMAHWTFPYLLRMQRASIEHGLAMGLFSNVDTIQAVWYGDYLLNVGVMYNDSSGRGLENQSKEDSKPAASKPKGKPAKGKKPSALAKKKADASKPEELLHIATPASVAVLPAKRDILRGFFRMSAMLARIGLIELAKYDHGSDSLRFEDRFAAVLRSHEPNPLSYSDFLSSFDCSSVDPDRMMRSALQALTGAASRLQAVQSTLLRECSEAPPDAALPEDLHKCPAEFQDAVRAVSASCSALARDVSGKSASPGGIVEAVLKHYQRIRCKREVGVLLRASMAMQLTCRLVMQRLLEALAAEDSVERACKSVSMAHVVSFEQPSMHFEVPTVGMSAITTTS
jgi:hypothetical protein